MKPETRLTAESLFSRNPRISTRAIDGTVVLVDPDDGQFYGLENVAMRIWEILELPSTFETICASLKREFSVDGEICGQDALAFLTELRDAGLVVLL